MKYTELIIILAIWVAILILSDVGKVLAVITVIALFIGGWCIKLIDEEVKRLENEEDDEK